MILAVVRQRLREGRRPPRDVVLAFLADEEAGRFLRRPLPGRQPARSSSRACTEAVSEVGGFSVTLGGQRLYLIQTAEKGMAWLRLTARGTGRARLDAQRRQRGHRTRRDGRPDRPRTIARCGSPRRSSDFLAEVCDRARPRVRAGRPPRQAVDQARLAVPAHRRHPPHTANPTMLEGRIQGQRHPAVGHRRRRRALPARPRGRVLRRGRRACSGRASSASSSTTTSRVETTFGRRLCDAMIAALLAEDPGARVGPVLPVRRDRHQVLRRARHAVLRLRPAAAARRTWTSPACSTAWTSGCRCPRCSSARACWTASSTAADGQRFPLKAGTFTE